MDIFTAVPIAVGVALGAAVAAQKTVSYLKNSDLLSKMVLEWLTFPSDVESAFHAQFLQVQRRLFGAGVFSLRRSVFIAGIYVIIWLIEIGLICYHDYFLYVKMPDWLFGVWFFASSHVSFMKRLPLESIFLVALSFVFIHVAYWFFDRITLKSIAFGNRLYIYLLLTLAGYAVVYVFVWWIIATILAYFQYLLDTDSILATHSMTIGSLLKEVLIFPFTIGLSGVFTDPLGGLFVLSAACMCITSLFNLIYAAALLIMRIDYFLRKKYRWKQDELLKNPIEYLSYIAASVVFLLALPVALAMALDDGPDPNIMPVEPPNLEYLNK